MLLPYVIAGWHRDNETGPLGTVWVSVSLWVRLTAEPREATFTRRITL